MLPRKKTQNHVTELAAPMQAIYFTPVNNQNRINCLGCIFSTFSYSVHDADSVL